MNVAALWLARWLIDAAFVRDQQPYSVIVASFFVSGRSRHSFQDCTSSVDPEGGAGREWFNIHFEVLCNSWAGLIPYIPLADSSICPLLVVPGGCWVSRGSPNVTLQVLLGGSLSPPRARVRCHSVCPVGLARSKLPKAMCRIGYGLALPSSREARLVPASAARGSANRGSTTPMYERVWLTPSKSKQVSWLTRSPY